MRGRPAGQTVRRTVFGGRAESPPPYGRLRRPALRAVSLRLAGACGEQGPVFCGLCWRAAGRKPRQKNRKPAITHENPGKAATVRAAGPAAPPPKRAAPVCPPPWAAGGLRRAGAGILRPLQAGGRLQAPAKKPQARNNPRKPGARQRLCGPQARRLRRRNGLRPFARRRGRRAAGGPPPALHKPNPTENSRQAQRPSGVILSRYSVIRRCRPPRQSPTALPHHR